MRKRKLLAPITLALALVLSACASKPEPAPPAPSPSSGSSTPSASSSPSNSTAPEAPAEIKIGAVVPATGKESKIGEWYRHVYEFAADQVNKQGGIMVEKYGKRIPVKMIILDDQTDQEKTISLTERLITQEKVVALLGGYTTPLNAAQSVVAQRYKIPFVAGGTAATAPFSPDKDFIYGAVSPVDVLGATTMNFLKEFGSDQGKLPKPAKVVLLWENTSHGKDYREGIRKWIEANPGYFDVVLDEGFELYQSDYTALLTKAKTAGGDIFLADAHLEDYITMHRQYTEMGLKHKMISYGARGPDPAAREALGAAADYVFAGSWWEPDLPYPQVKQYIKDFEAFTASDGKQRKANVWYAALGYGAPTMLFQAIESAGSLDAEAIRDALAAVEVTDSIFPGQRLAFDGTHQIRIPYVLVQNFPDGSKKVVYPSEAKIADPVVPIPGT